MRTHTIQKLILVATLALSITGIFSNAALAVTCSEPSIIIGSGETCSDTVILGSSTTISNSGTMDEAGGLNAIQNRGVITNLTNYGSMTIIGTAGGATLQNGVNGGDLGTINLLNNYGSITNSAFTIYNRIGSIETLNNYNSIISTGGNAIQNNASIGLINNTSGSFITGSSFDSGIYNGLGATITNISNAGSISGLY